MIFYTVHNSNDFFKAGCKDVVAPENGKKEVVKNTINFKCNDGFKLEGASNIECLNTGKWNNEAPTCKCKL